MNGAGAGFVPIHPNPYIVGQPVRGSEMFFGREVEFELVRKRLSGAGGLFVFCGERRSGKTSILFQILDHRLGPAFIPVLIDMQSMAISNEGDFLSKICDEIFETLGPEAAGIARPDFASATNCAATFHDFIERVLRTHPDKKLVLLFDEYELFENKIDAGVLGDDVLRILASLMEKRAVFLVFTGSQNLDQRRPKYWGILSKASTFKEISYLEPEDALNLIQKPVAGVVRYALGSVEAIYRLTSGQPFYTQAVCRDLVDCLNDQRTNDATVEMVGTVVERLVKNPLPQMNFHWQSLDRDEKLVLALLAEVLPDELAFAKSDELVRAIRRRKYPLDLDKPRIELALEKLFASHLLFKNEQIPPGYSYQLDLWRLWIRRMHSPYQVMREEGLDIRQYVIQKRRRRILRAGAAAATIAAIAGLIPRPLPWHPPPSPSPLPRGVVAFTLAPPDAQISRDGQAIGTGVSLPADSVEVGRRGYRFSALGYVDTAFTVQVDPGVTVPITVALRARVGALEIVTEPANADIWIDGDPQGFRSPHTITGLGASKSHRIRASIAGRSPVDTSVAVIQDSTVRVRIRLAVQQVEVFVMTHPDGAVVTVDGISIVTTSPIQLGVATHTFAARAPGYADLQKRIDVRPAMPPVLLDLSPLPDGVLVVKGSIAGKIFVDGVQRRTGEVQNSGPVAMRPGRHRIRIELRGKPVIEDSIVVRPDTTTTFDFDTRQFSHEARPGADP